MVVFHKFLGLQLVVFVEQGKIDEEKLTFLESNDNVLCPQWVYMHACDRIVLVILGTVLESAIGSARLPIVTVEGSHVCTDHDDFVRDRNASWSLIAQLRVVLRIVQSIVAWTYFREYSLLDALFFPQPFQGLRCPFFEHDAVVHQLLLCVPDEKVLALIDQLDHVFVDIRVYFFHGFF